MPEAKQLTVVETVVTVNTREPGTAGSGHDAVPARVTPDQSKPAAAVPMSADFESFMVVLAFGGLFDEWCHDPVMATGSKSHFQS
jgi:hypothetical protein